MDCDPLAVAMAAIHDALDACFHAHQVALVDRDPATARRELDRFADLLMRHARDEEQHLLPVYRAHGGDDTNSPTGQFLLEHDKMARSLDALDLLLTEWTDPADTRALLELLDRETSFKNLLSHHDLRERRTLYPRLGEWLSTAAQRELLAHLDLLPGRPPLG